MVNQNFGGYGKNNFLLRYAKIFKNILYIVNYGRKMAGFCSYYIKPVGTLHGIQKIAIIFSLVIYEQFRRKGIGTYLLKTSFTELKLNGIWDIYLCMNKDNSPAVSLYKKLGFAIIEKNCNIAEDKEGGHYLMHLVL